MSRIYRPNPELWKRGKLRKRQSIWRSNRPRLLVLLFVTFFSFGLIVMQKGGLTGVYNEAAGLVSQLGSPGDLLSRFGLGGCNIKGNVSYYNGARIYHVPGQMFYDRTVISYSRGERYFCSEADALAAGWRKARR